MLAESDPDRAAERIEIAGLIAERRRSGRVAHIAAAGEQIVDADRDSRSAEEGRFTDQSGLQAEIGEDPQIDRRQRGEAQVARGGAEAAALDFRRALPIAVDEGAETVLEDRRLGLDLVAARARGGSTSRSITPGSSAMTC